MPNYGKSLLNITRHLPWRFSSRHYSSSFENRELIRKYKENQAKQDAEPTYRVMRDEFSDMKKRGEFKFSKPKVPKFSEFVVIGGGMVGSAIAYSLKERAPDSYEVMVIERDPKYTRASTTLSVGGIRQQFSIPENIQLSMYGAEFLRNVKQHLSVLDDDPPDIQFQPHGYLFMASEKGAEQMMKNYKIQKELGAKVELIRPNQLKSKFPWINTEEIELASLGFENEGWFDPWSLLSAFKKKAISLGTDYINGELIGFEFRDDSQIIGPASIPEWRANYLYLKDEEGEVHCVEFATLIVAAGCYSGDVAKLLKIGSSSEAGFLQFPMPVEPRKRYVYVFNCENGPGIDMPLIIDPSGTYARREGLGGTYICGRSPCNEEEPDCSNLEVDYNYFDSNVWPALAKRVPAFEAIKVSSAWAGYYDYNVLDQNVIFGRHPYYPNVFFATGFSGHGIQMAPAVGRAMMELLVDKCYVTIDMTRFHFDRFLANELIYEECIV